MKKNLIILILIFITQNTYPLNIFITPIKTDSNTISSYNKSSIQNILYEELNSFKDLTIVNTIDINNIEYFFYPSVSYDSDTKLCTLTIKIYDKNQNYFIEEDSISFRNDNSYAEEATFNLLQRMLIKYSKIDTFDQTIAYSSLILSMGSIATGIYTGYNYYKNKNLALDYKKIINNINLEKISSNTSNYYKDKYDYHNNLSYRNLYYTIGATSSTILFTFLTCYFFNNTELKLSTNVDISFSYTNRYKAFNLILKY